MKSRNQDRLVEQRRETVNLVEFWAYRPKFSSSIRQLIGLGGLFCQLNVQNKKAWLQESKPAKMLCTGHREFGTNR